MGGMVKTVTIGRLLGTKPIVGDCYGVIGIQNKLSGQYAVTSFIFTASRKVGEIVSFDSAYSTYDRQAPP